MFSAVLAVRATALVARAVLASHNATAPAGVTVHVVEGHTRRNLAADARDYVFVVDATNSSRVHRRLSGTTLRITYRTRANFLGAVDLPSDETIGVPAGKRERATLRFSTSNVIPRHCRIDAYTLLFADDSGARVVADGSLPAVLQADSDGTGPATWGWD